MLQRKNFLEKNKGRIWGLLLAWEVRRNVCVRLPIPVLQLSSIYPHSETNITSGRQTLWASYLSKPQNASYDLNVCWIKLQKPNEPFNLKTEKEYTKFSICYWCKRKTKKFCLKHEAWSMETMAAMVQHTGRIKKKLKDNIKCWQGYNQSPHMLPLRVSVGTTIWEICLQYLLNLSRQIYLRHTNS